MKFSNILQALLAAVLFGVATPFSKTLLADLSPNLLAGLLYLGAAVAMLPLVLRRLAAHKPVFPRDRRNRRNLLGAVFFGGMVGPVLLLFGLRHALAASVSMWLNLETVATAALAVLVFREHVGRWTWVGSGGIVAAGALLGFSGGWAGWMGLMFVAGAAAAWGADNNLTAIIDGISPEDCTFWKGLIAGTTNLLIGLSLFPWRVETTWLAALAVGGLSYGLSVALYIRSAQGLGATRAQMVFASAPFFGVLLSVLWLKEGLDGLQGGAAALLVVSIILMFADHHEHEHVHEAITHEHEHRHDDGHHTHEHEGLPRWVKHTHVHTHERLVHSHPHWPDIHHRHH